MAVDLILEPSTIFISEDDWNQETLKKEFLNHILDILSEVDDLKVNKILWSDNLESILWASPRFNPWKDNRLIPIIYQKLNPNRIILSHADTCCEMEPQFEAIESGELLIEKFKELCNCAVNDGIPFNIVLGMKNSSIQGVQVHSTLGLNYTPRLLANKIDYLREVDIINELWPSTYGEVCLKKFGSCLRIVHELFFPTLQFKYRFKFERAFIESISICDPARKERLVKKIVHRLVLTSMEAAQDGSLQDEYIETAEERRFRVAPRPSSTRIHYIFNLSGEFVFLKYYGPGEHDDGL